jgi:hypothetical protein
MSSTSKIPGPGSYVMLLDNVVQKRASEQRFGSPIRPSNAGSCTRRIAHDYLGYLGLGERVEEVRKPSVNRLLGLGHYIEEQVVKDLKDIPGLGVRFEQQVVDMFRLEGGTNVEGSLDAFMWSEEVRGVLDVKSMGDRWHNHFNTKWESYLAAYAKHSVQFDINSYYVENLEEFLYAIGTEDSLYKNLIQLNLYACTPFLQERRVDHGSIVRYNKNNSTLMEIRFKPSMAVFETTQARLQSVENAGTAKDATVAPKERVLGDMDCAYCPYQKKCWPGASKRELYAGAGGKKWATKLHELDKEAEVRDLFERRAYAEAASEDLAKLDRELIILLDGHGVNKLKLENGDVFEVKVLKSGAELRRSKE